MPWLGTIGPVLTVADVAAVVVAGLVAPDAAPATLAVAAAVAVLVARAADLHRPRLVLSIVEDLPGLLVAAAAATAVLVGAGSTRLAFCVLALACLVLAHTAGLRRHPPAAPSGGSGGRCWWSAPARRPGGSR